MGRRRSRSRATRSRPSATAPRSRALVGPATRVLANGAGAGHPRLHGRPRPLDSTAATSSPASTSGRLTRPRSSSPGSRRTPLERQPGEWILGGDWDHERWPGAPLPRREWIDSVTPEQSRLRQPARRPHGAGQQPPRSGRPASTGHTRDIPGGSSCATRAPASRPAFSRTTRDESGRRSHPRRPPTPSATPRSRRAPASRPRRASPRVAHVTVGPGRSGALPDGPGGPARSRPASRCIPAAGWRAGGRHGEAAAAGDDWLRLAGVKGFMDGSLGSTTALFYEPYNDDPGTSGCSMTPEDSLRALDRRGRLGRASGRGARHRRAGQRPDARHLRQRGAGRMARGPPFPDRARPASAPGRTSTASRAIGVIASMQPYHAIDDGRWAEKRIGPERVKTTYVFRSLLDKGRAPGFGSDWTVAPIDPAARYLCRGHPPDARREASGGLDAGAEDHLDEALRAYTSGTPTACSPSGRGGGSRRATGGPRAARPGPDPDSAGSHRAGSRAGDGGRGQVVLQLPLASHWGESRSQPGWTSVGRAPAQRNGCGLGMCPRRECFRCSVQRMVHSPDWVATTLPWALRIVLTTSGPLRAAAKVAGIRVAPARMSFRLLASRTLLRH